MQLCLSGNEKNVQYAFTEVTELGLLFLPSLIVSLASYPWLVFPMSLSSNIV